MTRYLQLRLIEILTYFKNGLDDIESGSNEKQPMQKEITEVLKEVKKLNIVTDPKNLIQNLTEEQFFHITLFCQLNKDFVDEGIITNFQRNQMENSIVNKLNKKTNE